MPTKNELRFMMIYLCSGFGSDISNFSRWRLPCEACIVSSNTEYCH